MRFLLSQGLDELHDLSPLFVDLLHAEPILGQSLHVLCPEELSNTRMERSDKFNVLISTLPLKDFLSVMEKENSTVHSILLFRLNRDKC